MEEKESDECGEKDPRNKRVDRVNESEIGHLIIFRASRRSRERTRIDEGRRTMIGQTQIACQ